MAANGDEDKKSSATITTVTSAPPERPRDEVVGDIVLRLSALEAIVRELRSPAVEEVLLDFVSLMRCRLRPLQEGTEKPVRTKMGGYKPFTDDEPSESTDESGDVADDEAVEADV